jgi:2-polyprenyl-3-methyl-5-hydroxy-6-metoxy-1,4-benzoquinol methylase
MTYRALELLNLPEDEPSFLLDIGCGSGLSGEILDEHGYVWVGVDIAPSMLGEPDTNAQASPADFSLIVERLLWKEKWKVIYSCKISDKGSGFVQVVSMGRSGKY